MPERKLKYGENKKSKLKPERVAPLLEAIKMGLSYDRACQIAGISPKTLTIWRRKAKDARSHPSYKEFSEKFEKASAECELWHAENITGQAEDDWRASMFILKARFPEDWGERTIVEMPWEEHFRERGIDPQEVMQEFIEFIAAKFEETADMPTESLEDEELEDEELEDEYEEE